MMELGFSFVFWNMQTDYSDLWLGREVDEEGLYIYSACLLSKHDCFEVVFFPKKKFVFIHSGQYLKKPT